MRKLNVNSSLKPERNHCYETGCKVVLWFGFVCFGFVFFFPFCRPFLCFEHETITSFVGCWALLGVLTVEIM